MSFYEDALSVTTLVRPARPEDEAAIAALLQPWIDQGLVLPRQVRADEFLVAEDHTGLIGAVGLAAWTDQVVELSSLVSARPGTGRMLVEAAVDAAAHRGHHTVVALTGTPAFFHKVGFGLVQDGAPPHRQRASACELGCAVAVKAARCAACPRRHTCDQNLFSRRVA